MFTWIMGLWPQRDRDFFEHTKAITHIAYREQEDCNAAILSYVKHHKLGLDTVKELLRHDVIRELELLVGDSKLLTGEAIFSCDKHVPTDTDNFFRPKFECIIHRLEINHNISFRRKYRERL